MASNIRKFLEGLKIVPKASSTIDETGELEVISGSGKLNYRNNLDLTPVSPVVTEAHLAVLTNKTIDGDDNTIQDVGISSLKTVLGDADKVIRRDGSGIVISGNSLPNSSQIVTLDSSDTLTNKTLTSPVLNTPTADTITGIAGGTLTVQSASNENLSLQAQGTGVVSLESLTIDANTITGGAAQLTIQSASNQDLSLQAQGTGLVKTLTTLDITSKLLTDITNDNTSGSNAALVAPTTVVSRLTNASLVSVDTIPSGSAGQKLTIINATGVGVIINNDAGSSVNSIYTGTGGSIVLNPNASLDLIYDSSTSRWRIIGGVGGAITSSLVAGENLTAGNLVYISVGAADGGRTAGRAYKLDATNDTRIDFIGVVLDTVSTGASTRVQLVGEVSGLSGLSQGDQVFASVSSPGGTQTTAPSSVGQWIISLGIAKDSSTLIINPAAYATAIKNTAAEGLYLTVVSKTANYNISNADDVILADANSGAFTLTLPSPTSGKFFTVKKIDSSANLVNISPFASETIDGLAGRSLIGQYDSVQLTSDGTNWFII